MTKETAIRNYRKFSGADAYILGFVQDHILYAIKVDEIMPRYIRIKRASSSKGGGEKLQMYLTTKERLALIRKGAEVIGTDADILNGGNKGIEFEKLIYRLNGQTPQENGDKVRFDKRGDINIDGIEYQIKFNDAQIVMFSTLEKIKRERRASH